jgi:hypothetical protein
VINHAGGVSSGIVVHLAFRGFNELKLQGKRSV